MIYCIIQNNQDYLFGLYSGSLKISHSFIDHSLSSFSIGSTVSTAANISFTNRVTYQLQFFNSHYCNNDIPLIDEIPIQTIEKSPMRSLEEIISRINEETLRMTFERKIKATPMNTLEETLLYSPEETKMKTPEGIEMNNDSSSNSLIFVVASLSIIVLILVIIYAFGLILNSKQEISNQSSSKSEEKISSTI